MLSLKAHFSSIWIVVVTVLKRPGERSLPVRVVASTHNQPACVLLIDGLRLQSALQPPYPIGASTLLVTVDANETIACHLALGWPVPQRIIDLTVEFRILANRRRLPAGAASIGCLLGFGHRAAHASMENEHPHDYHSHFRAVVRLFYALEGTFNLGLALLRGRYMVAVARMEAVGVLVDLQLIGQLSDGWSKISGQVIAVVDREFGVYDGERFRADAFEVWLARRGIVWPRAIDGRLDVGDKTFREMVRLFPELRPLKEIRTTLAGFDPNALAIGRDGRNRVPLRPFASRTGRNQPSARGSVLGTAAWVRHLIKPAPGNGLAMIDWSEQEFGIAAALSGDIAMQAAYHSGDAYMALAIAAKAAPADANKVTHGQIRESFKACAVGVQYGMGAATLARQLGCTAAQAQELLRTHRHAYPRFWSWSTDVENHALLQHEQQSVFGWCIAVSAESNALSIRNFPMQSNGAEMLRLACCLATERAIKVCMPNHDALLIEAQMNELNETVAAVKQIMAEASATVLDGFMLRTDVRTVLAPEHWTDHRGRTVWSAVKSILGSKDRPAHARDATCSPPNPRPISYCPSVKDSADASY